MARFTKHNNPNKKRARRRSSESWCGCGTRDRYIDSLIRIAADNEKFRENAEKQKED